MIDRGEIIRNYQLIVIKENKGGVVRMSHMTVPLECEVNEKRMVMQMLLHLKIYINVAY